MVGGASAMPARSGERLLARCGGAATKLTQLNGERLSGFWGADSSPKLIQEGL
jgi:hypothetical protein